MTTIIAGMTPTQYLDALNNNFTQLRTDWAAGADSFMTLGSTTATPSNVNANLRQNKVAYGQKASLYVSALNSGFTADISRFQDGLIENIKGSGAYGEGTCLISDDGNQIDFWFTNLVDGHYKIYYTYSTDGLTFAEPQATTIPNGYLRSHALKVGNTYYHYATGAEGAIDTVFHLFTSTDKINYTDQGQVLARGSSGHFDATNLGNMFVWKEGSNWYMLYEAKNVYWSIGLATSSDGINWTKYSTTPLIEGSSNYGCGNPELPRVNNEVIKYNGKYYCYYHYSTKGTIYRAYSTDLHTWTVEGPILEVHPVHAGMISYGDQCMCQFKGKSYLFPSPSNQVDTAHIDCTIDNRTLAELLALYP